MPREMAIWIKGSSASGSRLDREQPEAIRRCVSDMLLGIERSIGSTLGGDGGGKG